MFKTLVIVPVKPTMSRDIYSQMVSEVTRLMSCTPIESSLLIDMKRDVSLPSDCRPWSKVARVRQRIIDTYPWQHFTHLLWIDADVVKLPFTLLTDLLKTNARGVAAPMVRIEGRSTFYDWAAFVYAGKDHISMFDRMRVQGRNINTEPPYFLAGTPNLVEMDCVGTVTLVNTNVYKAGARYEDHPVFTDHYSICKKARDLRLGVTVNQMLWVEHADLPKYGEKWH